MDGRAGEQITEAADRGELLSLLGAITETRLNRPVGREGWTLRHALGAVAAADRVLAHVLGSFAAEPQAAARFHLRRLRGEIMYGAHMLRREGLQRLLEETHAEAETALRAHARLLDRPIEVEGSEAMSANDLLADRIEQERTAIRALRAALPPGAGPARPQEHARPA